MAASVNTVHPIGISLGSGPVSALPARLAECAALGLRGIEIGGMTGDVIIDGALQKGVMREIRRICADHPFRYTVHCNDAQKLRDDLYASVHRRVCLAGLDLAAEIGAEVFVAHYSARSADPVIEARFERTMLEMADAAAERKVILGVENIENEPIESVLDFLERSPHPAMAFTLDFGHAWLTHRHFGGSMEAQLERARPFLRHMHIHDNAGRYDPDRLQNRQKPLRDRLPLGIGDLHLCPGWGSIPFPRLLPLTGSGYRGIYMMEHSVGTDAASMREAMDLIESCLS